MNKFTKYTLNVLGAFLFVCALLIFRPVPIVSEHKAITENGIVTQIYSNQGNDIIFILKGNKTRFYINRGLEYGLELNDLKEKLIGKLVVVKYPKYWTPLDWNNSIRHLSKVEFNNEVLFNELK
ncbi:MAG: hypothetical protein BM564_01275 [Bacteroidetes bacterium MedPE-SWsnd-G2]|nr:MAG: hypothetical protein BM564_01275 [Bacteroidetes bacterium MedPE-SWsnd-G2]